MPPWHAAPPRNTGAAAGLGAAVMGRGVAARLMGAGKGCCAVARDESAKDATIAAIAIRMLEKGIKVTAKISRPFDILKLAQKEIGGCRAN
jgi:hypothetical protein